MSNTNPDTSFLTPIDTESDAYRSLPHNLELEQALLGAVLVDNESALRIPFLAAHHLYEPLHQRIYETITKLIERGQLAVPATVKTYMETDEALQAVGGAGYLARLAAGAVASFYVEEYGRTLYDLSVRRALIGIGEEAAARAGEADTDVAAIEQVEATEQALFSLAESGEADSGFRAFSSSLAEAVEAIEAAKASGGTVTGVSTGLTDVDRLLGGLHKSDLLILAGRPGMGKTALATNIAFAAAKRYFESKQGGDDPTKSGGAVVGFFSLEMSAEQLATRILSEEAGIPSEKLRKGQITPDDFQGLARAARTIEDMPFFIDDTPALPISSILSRARRLKRQHGLSMVVVDYLQLARPSGRQRSENRVQEVSEITQGLKAMAKTLEVPVLALAQLSRAVEQRDDKRPMLSDLRESGSIEQDADVVMFVYREEYYHERKRPEDEGSPEFLEWEDRMKDIEGITQLIVGKQRHGPTGTVQLLFNKQTTQFANLDRSERPDKAPF